MPSVAVSNGSSTCRAYGFRDLVALRAARELRSAGVPLQSLRRVVVNLQMRGYDHPLADAYLVVSVNGDVVEMDGDTPISALHSPGQAYFVFALGNAVGDLEAIAGTLRPPARGKACSVA